MTLKNITVTKSQLFMWDQCPAKFEYHYIRRVPIEELGIEVEIGRGFHSFSSRFFDMVDHDALMRIKCADKAFELFEQLLPEEPMLVREGCQNFIRFEANQWEQMVRHQKDPLRYWIPVDTEREIVVHDDMALLHVDRIDRLADESLCIIEYKPQIHPQFIKRELAFYAIYVEKAKIYDQPVTHVGCFGYRTNEAQFWPVSTRINKNIQLKVAQFRTARLAGSYPKRKSFICQWCWYVNHCYKEENEQDEGGV